jgi:four helix bundle protein
VYDFEKLDVYVKSKKYNKSVTAFLKTKKQDRVTNDQLRRASFSIMLNIAEGSGRFTNKDKRNFYVIARGSVIECVAIFDYLKEVEAIEEDLHIQYYKYLGELSKMLFGLSQKFSTPKI